MTISPSYSLHRSEAGEPFGQVTEGVRLADLPRSLLRCVRAPEGRVYVGGRWLGAARPQASDWPTGFPWLRLSAKRQAALEAEVAAADRLKRVLAALATKGWQVVAFTTDWIVLEVDDHKDGWAAQTDLGLLLSAEGGGVTRVGYDLAEVTTPIRRQHEQP